MTDNFAIWQMMKNEFKPVASNQTTMLIDISNDAQFRITRFGDESSDNFIVFTLINGVETGTAIFRDVNDVLKLVNGVKNNGEN
ncbi:hypothetical protein FC35_GL001464 [Limosilactobacillus coleohominis DSM 14060]|nr:hypothetical protein FC35_GL001464 [Limosilactobacillus coleohominis DSM 14060]